MEWQIEGNPEGVKDDDWSWVTGWPFWRKYPAEGHKFFKSVKVTKETGFLKLSDCVHKGFKGPAGLFGGQSK